MLRKSPLLAFLASTALLSSLALADTITLTTGEKIEGKITSETATELTVEVKISAGITDETKVLKSKVAQIDKVQPDEIAWQPLKNIKLGTNSLQAPQYDAFTGPLQGFVNEYPQSAHAAEAAKILSAFTEERARVEAGEVRLGEKWLSKDEVNKERYQINAQLTYQYLLGQRAAGDLTGALNTFDLLEKNYPNSRSYPDAVDVAKTVLAALKAAVDRAQVTFKQQQDDYEKGLAQTSVSLKPELIAARQHELDQGDVAIAKATRAGLKWSPLIPRSDKSFAPLLQKIPDEQQRLASLDTGKFRQSIQLAEQAKKEIADKKADDATTTLQKATDLWSSNELLTRLEPELASLKESLATAAAAPAEAPATDLSAPMPVATPASHKLSEADAEPSTESTGTEQEEAKPFYKTPTGAIAIVIVIALLGALGSFLKKRKSGDEDDTQA